MSDYKKENYKVNAPLILMNYLTAKKRFDNIKKKFETTKNNFEEFMNEYFSLFPPEEGKTNKFQWNNQEHSVTKVEKSTINWNIKRLKRQLPKALFNIIIKKQYIITNYNDMVILMKEYGVPASRFKEFINVSESVNEEALDNAYDVGTITKEQISGCYSVIMHKPYFTVK